MLFFTYSFIAVLLSYLSSQYIYGGDSAEFSAVAHTWSIPHPPGYPLYTFLANCITRLIPFGTIPWRTALLSSIPSAFTALFLFKIFCRIGVRRGIAFLSSLIFLVLFPVWEYALVPEVFALNTFLVIGITLLLLVGVQDNASPALYIAAFCIGLSISHHHIFVLFIPGWIALVGGNYKRINLIKCILLIMGGALFYLYVPLAGLNQPPIQWENGATLYGFWRLITRAAYGTFTAYGGAKWNIQNQLYDLFSSFVLVLQDFRVGGIIFIVWGIIASIKHTQKRFFRFLAISAGVHMLFLFYTNFVLTGSFTLAMYERFLISYYAVLIVYFAVGFDSFVTICIRFIRFKSQNQRFHSFAFILLFLILGMYGVTLALTNWPAISYIRKGQDFDRLGKDIIHTIPSGGIFFAGHDNANFATLYHYYEAKIPTRARFFQLTFMQQPFYIEAFKKRNPDLHYPQSFNKKDDLQEFYKLNVASGVYLDSPMPYGMWMPYGLLWKFYPTLQEATADLPFLIQENKRLWKQVYHIPKLDTRKKNLLHLQTVQDYYVEAYMRYARLLFLAEKRNEAREVVQHIITTYRPTQPLLQQTLDNLILYEKSCAASPELCHTPYSK